MLIRHRQRVHYEGSGIPGKVFSTQDASGQQLLQYSAGPSLAEMQSVMHKLGSLTPCPALAYQSVPWIVAVTHLDVDIVDNKYAVARKVCALN